MSNETNLQVTFSKRRAGLFKKASELCTLCGSQAAMVVFSPAAKVFCFGHPSVQTVINKFEELEFSHTAVPSNYNNARSQVLLEAHRNSTIRELNLELTHVESLLKAEKQHAEEYDLLRKSGQMEGWFFPSFDGLNNAQLSVLKDSIMGFKKNLDVKVQNDMFALTIPLPNDYLPAWNRENLSRGMDLDVSSVHAFNNNAQLSLVSNDLIIPNYSHDANEYSDNIGLLGGHQGTNIVYGSIDDTSNDCLSSFTNV